MEQKFSEVFVINPKLKLNKNQKIDFVEMKNIESGKRSVVSEYKKEFKGSGSKFERGDTLFARITPCLENGKISRYDGPGTAFGSTEFIVIRGKEGVTLSNFAYYYSTWEKFREFCIQNMIGSSGRQRVPVDALDNWTVSLPSLPEQKKIADLLDSFDSKIELNLKMNETLEEIAKTLFKSWFIDFDPVRAKAEGRPTGLSKEISDLFPDSFEDSELGDIPKDWKVESIESLSSKIAMGPFGSDMKTSTYVEEGVPIISGKQMSGYLLKDEDNNFISPSHAQKLKNSLVQRGDTVITQTGTVGQVSLIPQNSKYSQYIVSSRQHFCRPLEDNLQEYLFCFLTSGKGQHELLKNVVTTGVPSISRPVTNLKSIQLVHPKRGVLDNFSQIVKPILANISLNISINRDLSNLRDTILPKLISGELKIPDAENLIEEADI